MLEQFEKLRRATVTRNREWNPNGNPVPVAFRLLEIGGEVGELQNAGKKLARHDLGLVGGTTDTTNLREELGDVIICAELIAQHYGIDLWQAVADKFNATSVKHNFNTRLE